MKEHDLFGNEGRPNTSISPFLQNHLFRSDDEKMMETVDSVRKYGFLILSCPKDKQEDTQRCAARELPISICPAVRLEMMINVILFNSRKRASRHEKVVCAHDEKWKHWPSKEKSIPPHSKKRRKTENSASQMRARLACCQNPRICDLKICVTRRKVIIYC